MVTDWPTTMMKDVRSAEGELRRLENEQWASRGHCQEYGSLTPSIDRGRLWGLPRRDKLQLERRSIELLVVSLSPSRRARRAHGVMM